MIKTVFDLDIFNLSYQLGMDVFRMKRNFSKEERYSLTDQIARSSRSISANIGEGWGKRIYEKEFKRHLICARVRWKKLKCGYTSARTVVISVTKYLTTSRKNPMN